MLSLIRTIAIAIAAACLGGAVSHLPQIMLAGQAGEVLTLMEREVEAAQNHDHALLLRIYSPNATVTDAGCRSTGTAQTWRGIDQIATRYAALPVFSSLEHANATVSWRPGLTLRPQRGDGAAVTIGIIAPTVTSGAPRFIAGHEHWQFAKSGDRWIITSFTYNLCLS